MFCVYITYVCVHTCTGAYTCICAVHKCMRTTHNVLQSTDTYHVSRHGIWIPTWHVIWVLTHTALCGIIRTYGYVHHVECMGYPIYTYMALVCHIPHVAHKLWDVYHVNTHDMWWHGVWRWYSNTMYTMIPNIMTYHDMVETWYGIHDTDISIMQPAASMPIIHLGMEYEDVDATIHTISTMETTDIQIPRGLDITISGYPITWYPYARPSVTLWAPLVTCFCAWYAYTSVLVSGYDG